MQAVVFAKDAMTGDEDQVWVHCKSMTHRPRPMGAIDLPRNVPIGTSRTIGDQGNFFQNFFLELGDTRPIDRGLKGLGKSACQILTQL